MAQQPSLVHLVREPTVPTGENPPLLLLLHGIGSYEGDLMSLAPHLDGRFFVVSARAPFSLGYGSYAWYRVDFSSPDRTLLDPSEPGRSRELLVRFVGELVRAYGLDEKRVYLLGFSQGAIMTLGTTLLRPDVVAGSVLMSGRTLAPLTSQVAPPQALEGLPLLVTHGTEDEVLPVRNGRSIRDLLESLPVHLTYREYSAGHEVTPEMLADVAEWLSARLDEGKSAS